MILMFGEKNFTEEGFWTPVFNFCWYISSILSAEVFLSQDLLTLSSSHVVISN